MRALLVLVVLVGCKPADKNAAAESCGEQGCPVGTAWEEYRAVREGFEVSAGADPKSYGGEVAFKHFGEGECAWTCVTINACPDTTFPVITESCFTCGTVNAQGEVVQGTCDPDDDSWDTGGDGWDTGDGG